LVAFLLMAAPAEAATFCVATTAPGCIASDSLSDALSAAADEPGVDTIRLGRLREATPVADAPGEAVRIVGAGSRATEVDGRVDLNEDGSTISRVTVRATGTALALRGVGVDVEVSGGARLRDGASLRSSSIAGPLVTAGRVRAHSVSLAGVLDVESGSLTADHLTVVGSGASGLRVAGGALATLSNSVVWGFASGITGTATVTFSHLPESGIDPLLLDLRPGPGSPLVDAGDPRPLDADEPEVDATGGVRAMDGDGDGVVRRDVGAYERRPPAAPPTAGNLLANGGAELGEPATDDRASPAPPRWRRSGGFTSVRYGTVVGPVSFPTLEAAAALDAGSAFFAAGPSGAASATQVVDVSGWAPEIDARAGFAVRLSALLGGFRLSEDRATVSAVFRGPFGTRLGGVALPPVSAADRGNATMLLLRSVRRAVPRLTRTIAVTVAAGAHGGTYNDAYADDVALVPRVPPLEGVPRRSARGRRPFGGVAVLARRVRVRDGRARVRIGCPSATRRRCAGTITLARRRAVVLGTRIVSLRPGEEQRVRIPLSRRERRVLRRPQGGHVYAAVRDAQGLTRSAAAPVRIVRR
jgi:hypothetical protein